MLLHAVVSCCTPSYPVARRRIAAHGAAACRLAAAGVCRPSAFCAVRAVGRSAGGHMAAHRGRGWAQSRRRCGRGEPSPGADVAAQVMHFADYSGAELLQIAMDMLAAKGFKLDADAQGRLKAMCDKTASTHDTQARSRPGSALGLKGLAPLPDPARPSRPGSPPPDRRQDRAHPTHICAGTGLTPPTSAPGPGSPPPDRRQDWAHPRQIGGAGYSARAIHRGALAVRAATRGTCATCWSKR
jgi:hypothetical protein